MTSSYRAVEDVDRLHFQASLTHKADRRCISLAVDTALRAGRTLPLRVLDVGFGSGVVTSLRFGGDARFQVTAIDRDERCVALARAAFAHPNVLYRAADVEQADIRHRYDIVWASYVVHHAQDPAVMLQRLWRLVDAGGALLVRTCDDDRLRQDPPNAFYEALKEASENAPGLSNRYHGQSLPDDARALQPPPSAVEAIRSSITSVRMTAAERRAFFDFVCKPRYDYWRRAALSGWGAAAERQLGLSKYQSEREAFAASRSAVWRHSLQIWMMTKGFP
ncbi:MAG: class I SAM-dependent methyltransferase [Hyphomonadaceae bacterium]